MSGDRYIVRPKGAEGEGWMILDAPGSEAGDGTLSECFRIANALANWPNWRLISASDRARTLKEIGGDASALAFSLACYALSAAALAKMAGML